MRSLSGRGENIKIGRVRQLFVLPLRSIVAQVVGRKRRDHRNGACDSLIVAGRVGCGLSSSGFTLFCRRKVFLPKGERKFRLPGNFCRSVPYFFFEEEHKVNLFRMIGNSEIRTASRTNGRLSRRWERNDRTGHRVTEKRGMARTFPRFSVAGCAPGWPQSTNF